MFRRRALFDFTFLFLVLRWLRLLVLCLLGLLLLSLLSCLFLGLGKLDELALGLGQDVAILRREDEICGGRAEPQAVVCVGWTTHW